MREIMIRLVLDIETMRVIYFTDDLNMVLTPSEDVLFYDFQGNIPQGMSLQNCWNWRLERDTLVETFVNKEEQQYTLFDFNKKECLEYLIRVVNEARRPYLPDCEMGIVTRIIKFQETYWPHSDFLTKLARSNMCTVKSYKEKIIENEKQLREILVTTEINREYFKDKILYCKNSDELYVIRDKISKCNFLEPQYE